jgi:YD repeat-containing protein
MKKLLTALALSATITATAYAQRPQTDRQNHRLKGPVKSVTVETRTLKKQGERYVEERRVRIDRVTYDAEGNLVEEESYGEDGRLISKAAYRYIGGEKIAEGQILTVVIISPSIAARTGGDAPPARPPVPRPHVMQPYTSKYKYKYDAEGNVKEMTVEERGRVRQRVVYDFKGDRKETRWYEGGHLINREVDKFDARGNLVETTRFETETGAVDYKYSYSAYEFDARGNWVKRLKTWSAAGEPEERDVEYRTITYF